MGNDGGSIPTRDELVKTKKKPEQKDKDGHRLYKWQHCALSQEPLRSPVVSCQMGRMYNKEAVIELLLTKDRSSAPPWAAHLEKLKDITELKLTPNPSFDANRISVGNSYNDSLVSAWICPVTGLEMNGRFKFVFSWPGGKVVAERAVKVMQQDPAEAPNFKEEDLIVVNPEEEEIDLMNSKMIARKARVKAEKKAKKKKGLEDKSSPDSDEPGNKKIKLDDVRKTDDSSKANGSKFNMFAEQARREKEEDTRPARDRGPVTSNQVAKYVADTKKKSVQEGGGSEVFKSLFTTHKSAQNKPKGHWVTFDPRYNC